MASSARSARATSFRSSSRACAGSSTAATTPAASPCTRTAACSGRAAPRAWPSCRPSAGRRDRQRHRHRAHALGHARRASGAQRAPALLARPGRPAETAQTDIGPDRAGAQRHHREPRRTARRAAGQGLRFDSQTDTEVIAHLVHQPLRRRSARGRAAGAAAPARRLRHRGVLPRRAAPRGRRARRARRWCWALGDQEQLPGLRRDGAGRRHRPHRLPGGRRRRRPADGPGLGQRAAARRRLPRRWSGRCAPCGRTAAPPSSAPTATTCRRRSSSSRARSPTRSTRARHQPRAVRRRRLPRLQGHRPRADPGLRHQLLRGFALRATGWSRSPASRPRWRSPASTATAPACPTRAPWSSRSRRAARPPTRWPR